MRITESLLGFGLKNRNLPFRIFNSIRSFFGSRPICKTARSAIECVKKWSANVGKQRIGGLHANFEPKPRCCERRRTHDDCEPKLVAILKTEPNYFAHLCPKPTIGLDEWSTQWAHYVASTSIQRRYPVATSYRRRSNVVCPLGTLNTKKIYFQYILMYVVRREHFLDVLKRSTPSDKTKH